MRASTEVEAEWETRTAWKLDHQGAGTPQREA